MTTDLAHSHLRTLSDQLTRGEVTASDLCEASLHTIATRDPTHAPAFLKVFASEARQAAARVDSSRANGEPTPPFAGIPFAVKDLFDIKGEITRAGAVVTDGDTPAAQDADVVAAMRQAGLVLIGTTNMTEFAFSGIGINPHFGTPPSTSYPGEQRVPGGSSSGAAVSLAQGMVPISLGTDTAGSCRIPAAWNGVVGFKPSQSQQSRRGVFPLSTTLDVPGPLALSVDCCRIVDALMRGQSPNQPSRQELATFRFIRPTFEAYPTLDPDVSDAYEMVMARLTAAGANLTTANVPSFADAATAFLSTPIAAYEAWQLHRSRLESDSKRYDPTVATRLRAGEQITPEEQNRRIAWRHDCVHAFKEATPANCYYLLPTTANTAPKIAELTDNIDQFRHSNLTALTLTSTANYLDACAISLPIGRGVGLSVIAPQGRDSGLLNAAEAIEKVVSDAHITC